ncbi:MAG: type II toxin-antitoxin system VapC family toxin [Chloroflexota bacterium]
MTTVCVDASLIVKSIVKEEDSHLADLLFAKWKKEEARLLIPAFAPAEVDSILRKKVTRGELNEEQAEQSFQAACNLPLEIDASPELRRQAWTIARQFRFEYVYDAVYLAIAESRKCEFWTADRKLYDKVSDKLKFVRHISKAIT